MLSKPLHQQWGGFFCAVIWLLNPLPHLRGYSPYLLKQQGERIGQQKVSGITTTHKTNTILSPCLERSGKIGGRGATATEGLVPIKN